MNNLFREISTLTTEKNNPNTRDIDTLSTRDILLKINDEDAKVADAVRAEIEHIEIAVDKIAEAFKNGGRLIYAGAGTSGRLGIVDASECPPTYGTPPEMVQAIIAGGTPAIFQAQEGAEDSRELAASELNILKVSKNDVVCGIAASGRTPFVIGALEEAKKRGAYTILVTTNSRENLLKGDAGKFADTLICPQVGPEVIAGSTRMKSGTAQKLVLNMLTTGAMIRIGKTYGNVMVDLQLTNEKLKERAKAILMNLADTDYDTAEETLLKTNGNVKTALVMLLTGADFPTAEELLKDSGGLIKEVLKKVE
ncbi:MAG: N-acetylmuramic acid 6-phosphate etherase [Bacteroidota bacterium]